MASYEDLFGLHNNSALKNKVRVACLIAAQTIMDESDQTANHANRLTWAKDAFESPTSVAEPMYRAMIAANADAAISAIKDASDLAIQANVDAAVDLFATGA